MLVNNENNSDSDSEITNNNKISFSQENDKGFLGELIVHQSQIKKISKIQLSLNKNKVFNTQNTLTNVMKNAFRRKNEILYCISTKEMSIDIKDVNGQVYLPLITKREISEKLGKIDSEIRKKINMIHIGAVKILIKAQFKNGIDTPIKMALIDNRINSRKDCILGAAQGNLAYGKFMFTVYPKFGISLTTANLDQTLSFIHNFERHDLMNKGDKVFSITYLLGYALTNSHHSIDYKNKSNIELDDVFHEIGSVEENQFCALQNEDTQWAIDIAKNKPFLGQNERKSITGNRLKGESSSSYNPRQDTLLRTMSAKIDYLGESLNKLYSNE